MPSGAHPESREVLVSRSLNKVTLIGNLGADPEVRSTGGGQRVATLSVATSRQWNNPAGERQEKTEWHRVVLWNTKFQQLADGSVAAVYDALRGDVYAAVYRVAADGVETLFRPQVTTLADLRARLPSPPGLVAGDLTVLDRDEVVSWTGRSPVAAGPRAAALIALDGVPGGIATVPDLVVFEPDYGRPAEAQARWERAHGRSLPDSRGEFR